MIGYILASLVIVVLPVNSNHKSPKSAIMLVIATKTNTISANIISVAPCPVATLTNSQAKHRLL